MKTNKILFIIISILILLGGIIYTILFINQKENSNNKVNNIDIKIQNKEKGLFTLNEAIDTLIIDNCSKLVQKDISKKNICLNRINYKLAFKNNSPKYCKLISDKKESIKCIIDLNKKLYIKALEDNDQELCILISNTKTKEKCIKEVDKYYCNNNDYKNIFDQDFKAECIRGRDAELFIKIKDTKESSLCEQLSDIDLKKKCTSVIDENLLIDALKIETCDKIIDKNIKKQCINKVNFRSGNYDKNSKSYCLGLDDDVMKNNCLDGYYLNKIESGISTSKINCENIGNIEVKNYCIGLLDKKIQSDKLKKEANILEQKGDYIGAINLQCKSDNIGNDINLCINQEVQKKAIKDTNISFCNKLSDTLEIERCKSNVSFELDSKIFKEAISKKDISLCNKISIIEKQKVCKNYFN